MRIVKRDKKRFIFDIVRQTVAKLQATGFAGFYDIWELCLKMTVNHYGVLALRRPCS